MSSRVQKGGPVFRPITKARSRVTGSVSRQASVSLDAQSPEVNKASSMPPPKTVPTHTQQTQPSPTPEPDHRLRDSAPQINLASRNISEVTQSAESGLYVVSLERHSSPPPGLPLPVSTISLAVPQMLPIGNVSHSSVNGSITSKTVIGQNIPRATKKGHQSGRETLCDSGNLVQPQQELRNNISLFETGRIDDNVPEPNSSADAIMIDRNDTVKESKRKRPSNMNTSESSEPPSSKSRATRNRTSRGPSLPPYNVDADPGEDIDPTVITMATLCTDTGQGRVSSKAAEILSNHAAWKVQNREKRARMKMLMESTKYGRKDDEENERGEDLTSAQLDSANNPSSSGNAESSSTIPHHTDETIDGFDYSQNLATSRFNVQVRIGPNGETIIDEDSLVVNREETDETDNYTHVMESDHTKFVNSGTYGKRYRGSRWSAEETELFYDALSQYGENYELIAYVLPGRDRKSCKNKFKVEDKKNHARINYCLNNRVPVDIQTLSRMTGKDFSGPVPDIRIPTSQPTVKSTLPDHDSLPAQPFESVEPIMKKRRMKKIGSDDGVVIVGDVDAIDGS